MQILEAGLESRQLRKSAGPLRNSASVLSPVMRASSCSACTESRVVHAATAAVMNPGRPHGQPVRLPRQNIPDRDADVGDRPDNDRRCELDAGKQGRERRDDHAEQHRRQKELRLLVASRMRGRQQK